VSPDDVYVHPAALVESDEVGPGTRVWAFAHVLAGARIGRDCNVGGHCFVEGGATVGDGVTLKNGAMVWEGVTLEDGVFVGPGAVFTNDLRPRSPRHPPAAGRYGDAGWLARTNVGRGATIGARAVILPGIDVGAYAMVAAGAVVTRSVPPHGIVMGNPARLAGWACVCGARLPGSGDRPVCRDCGRAYAAAGPEELTAIG
jgi:acetyltransferase-like isoleucine patch superfamily enzyme